jgi:tetratricopeptide (TPR) repeat protein
MVALTDGGRMPVIVVLVAMVLFAASPVGAQDAESRAEQLYSLASQAYEEGRFADSAALLEQAYAIQPDSILLYNIARARESEGDLDAAQRAYTRFLETAPPDAEERPRVERRLEIIAEEIAAMEANEHAAATREPYSVSAVPFVIGGAGIAGLVAGGVLGWYATDRSSAAEAAPSQRDAFPIAQEARDYALAANITLGVSGALALAGAIWGTVELVNASSNGSSAARLEVGPGGAGLAGTF